MRLDEKLREFDREIGIQRAICDRSNCILKIDHQKGYTWMKCEDKAEYKYNPICLIKIDLYGKEGHTCPNRKSYR